MSLVQKIPPMVSALAFGYGIVMAAPETTISRVSAAVAPSHEAQAQAPRQAPRTASPPALTRVTSTGIGGDESRELSRLREAAAREASRRDSAGAGAASCDLDRPSFWKA